MVNRKTITIHTRQRTVVRPLSDASLVRCSECQSDVLVVNIESVAEMLELNIDAVGELIDNGTLHLTTSIGARLICCDSLTNLSALQNQIQRKTS